MENLPPCPKCNYEYTYQDRDLFVCPECSHEWKAGDVLDVAETPGELVVKDANGNQLKDGDNVTVIKDLKIKGTSSVVKVGTKIKISRLTDGDHNIDCRVEGFGAMGLKSEFVKKVS